MPCYAMLDKYVQMYAKNASLIIIKILPVGCVFTSGNIEETLCTTQSMWCHVHIHNPLIPSHYDAFTIWSILLLAPLLALAQHIVGLPTFAP